MKWIKRWFKRLMCNHVYAWVRNVYGDEINLLNGKRSVWVCVSCGSIKYRDKLKPRLKL